MRNSRVPLSMLVLPVLLLGSADARAEPVDRRQHRNANLVVDWSTGQPLHELTQAVTIARKAPATFWALNWFWSDSAQGGYLGLQTDGLRFDGSHGETAIFSMWDAVGAAGDHCGAFGGEGVGLSCRQAMRMRVGHVYSYEVERLDADPAGQWWGARIRDATTGREWDLGAIQASPSRTTIGVVVDFVEYFGPRVECDAVPRSRATFARPTGDDGTIALTYPGGPGRRGRCTGGRAQLLNSDPAAIRIRLGGSRS